MPTLLDVMITTLGDGALTIKLPAEIKEVAYLIVVQMADAELKSKITNTFAERGDVRFVYQDDKGISKGRNAGLDNLNAKYALVADDDLEYLSGFHQKLFKAFSNIAEADIISFKAESNKTFSEKLFKHTKKTLGAVTSFEIAFKADSIKKNNLRFNEDFGLGTKYATGEEFLFLLAAFDKNLSIWFYPEALVAHPDISSGWHFSESLMIAKGALFKAGFPALYPIINFWFALKKYPQYRESFNLFKACKLLFSGSRQYGK